MKNLILLTAAVSTIIIASCDKTPSKPAPVTIDSMTAKPKVITTDSITATKTTIDSMTVKPK